MNLDEMVGKKEVPATINPGPLLTANEFLEAVLTPPGEESTAITFVIQKFKSLYDMKKLLKAKLEETQALLDQWESAVLERFNEEGVESMKTGMGTFFIRTETYCSFDHEREMETFSWLRENESGSIIKETINARTLAAWAKEQREQEIELPDFFNVTEKRKIGVRSK